MTCALKLEFSKQLFAAGEAVSCLLYDSPWHSECRFAARQLAINYIVKHYMQEARVALVRDGMDAARNVVGWEEDVFFSKVRLVAEAVRPALVARGGWRSPVKAL